MADIKDYKCNYENSAGINEDFTEELDISFPEVHHSAEAMAKLSSAMKEYDGAPFCELPFCHTVEAEALGGIINLGDGKQGPRTKAYITKDITELLELPEIDYSRGRIHDVIEAARILVENGEQVMFEVCGPVTIMNALIDPKYLFKGMRKQPELMKELYWKIGLEMIRFMKEIKNAGVQIISYADVVASVNILGPKMCEDYTREFTYEYVKELEKLSDDQTIVAMCPKTTFALLGCGLAELRDVKLPEPMSYQDATIYLAGKVRLGGLSCMKNAKYYLKDGIYKELVLK